MVDKNGQDQDLLLALMGEGTFRQRLRARWLLLTSAAARQRAQEFGVVSSSFARAYSGKGTVAGIALGIKLLFVAAIVALLCSSAWYYANFVAAPQAQVIAHDDGQDCSSEPGSVEEFKKTQKKGKGKGVSRARQ